MCSGAGRRTRSGDEGAVKLTREREDVIASIEPSFGLADLGLVAWNFRSYSKDEESWEPSFDNRGGVLGFFWGEF